MAWSLSISTSESQNAGANQSTVYANIYLNWNSWDSYANWNTSWSINIGGNVTSSGTYSGTYNYPNAQQSGSAYLGGHSVTFNHNPDGTRGAVGTSASFSTPTTYSYLPGPLNATGTTYPAIDYVRPPSAPATVTASAVGSVVNVTSSEASTPGPTITNYWVSYASSTNGGTTWSTWSTEVAMTSRAYSYTTLTPGLTYKFQVRAQNTDGYSAYKESATLFLTAGGKRYTGSNWALTATAAKRHNGTDFAALITAKRFDGTAWVALS